MTHKDEVHKYFDGWCFTSMLYEKRKNHLTSNHITHYTLYKSTNLDEIHVTDHENPLYMLLSSLKPFFLISSLFFLECLYQWQLGGLIGSHMREILSIITCFMTVTRQWVRESLSVSLWSAPSEQGNVWKWSDAEILPHFLFWDRSKMVAEMRAHHVEDNVNGTHLTHLWLFFPFILE